MGSSSESPRSPVVSPQFRQLRRGENTIVPLHTCKEGGDWRVVLLFHRHIADYSRARSRVLHRATVALADTDGGMMMDGSVSVAQLTGL